MGTVEHFEHTADVGLRLTATDLDDLFRTAAEGLFDYVVVNRDAIRATETEQVALQAATTAELLADWLGELIFRHETRHRIYGAFDVRVAPDGLSLNATIGGEPIDHDRHVLDHEVKAVTQHGLIVRRDGDGWFSEMILDI